MPDPRLERWFPNLAVSGYAITSPSTFQYNCFAWAAGDRNHWWEPVSGMRHYYWPAGVPRENTLAALTQVYAGLGYDVCDNAELESGFEKVALYIEASGEPTHAARQLASGAWTSKLGEWAAIEHNTLTALEGEVYGTVARILRRQHQQK